MEQGFDRADRRKRRPRCERIGLCRPDSWSCSECLRTFQTAVYELPFGCAVREQEPVDDECRALSLCADCVVAPRSVEAAPGSGEIATTPMPAGDAGLNPVVVLQRIETLRLEHSNRRICGCARTDGALPPAYDVVLAADFAAAATYCCWCMSMSRSAAFIKCAMCNVLVCSACAAIFENFWISGGGSDVLPPTLSVPVVPWSRGYRSLLRQTAAAPVDPSKLDEFVQMAMRRAAETLCEVTGAIRTDAVVGAVTPLIGTSGFFDGLDEQLVAVRFPPRDAKAICSTSGEGYLSRSDGVPMVRRFAEQNANLGATVPMRQVRMKQATLSASIAAGSESDDFGLPLFFVPGLFGADYVEGEPPRLLLIAHLYKTRESAEAAMSTGKAGRKVGQVERFSPAYARATAFEFVGASGELVDGCPGLAFMSTGEQEVAEISGLIPLPAAFVSQSRDGTVASIQEAFWELVRDVATL
eukprot:Amastigsp_a174398_1024.p1 type:complete len:471 gc:universal Amastigsp_a174398_1024:108-1520(+)